MPRKATGSVILRNGVWYARITLGPAERPPFALPTCTNEEQAETRCAVLSALASKLRGANQLEFAKQLLQKAATNDGRALDDVVTAVDRLCTERTIRTGALSGALTFQGFAEKWTTGELHETWPDHIKEKRSVSDDIYRLKRLYDWIGGVALTKFSLDDAERAMRQLPDGLSSASRRQYAQLMHRVLSMAVFPARIITVNPLPRGFLPSGKSNKALTYLYPSEDAQLLHAPAEKVPLCFRLFYGFLAREGMRTSEAAGLRWSDITWTDDGVAAVNLDENKTDDPRAWTLSLGVSMALEAWRTITSAGEDEDHIFRDEYGRPIDPERLAEKFRQHLKAAGVERKQLYETTANRRQIRAHDLRATFITIALATGRSEAWVTDRTGHESSVMLARYKRAARTVAELGAGDMLPLDEAVPELTDELKRHGKRHQISSTSGGTGRRTGFRFRRVKP